MSKRWPLNFIPTPPPREKAIDKKLGGFSMARCPQSERGVKCIGSAVIFYHLQPFYPTYHSFKFNQKFYHVKFLVVNLIIGNIYLHLLIEPDEELCLQDWTFNFNGIWMKTHCSQFTMYSQFSSVTARSCGNVRAGQVWRMVEFTISTCIQQASELVVTIVFILIASHSLQNFN